MVELRINGTRCDLLAEEARYHDKCYNNFRKIPIDSTKSESCRPTVEVSLKAVITGLLGQ